MHFNKNNNLSSHVEYQLQKMKPLFDRVIFLSNSKISPSDKKKVKLLCDDFIQRDNSGFDFAAWRDGMEEIGWKEIEKYDSMTLMNDTCFGPIYPIDNIYRKMEDKQVDFWGITNHRSVKNSIYGIGEVPYHIQSYMQVFSKSVIVSEKFKDFWRSVVDHTNVGLVVRNYEMALTGILEKAGFSHDVYFDTEKYYNENKGQDFQDYSHLGLPVILENKVPFIKVKAFLHNADNMYANEALKNISGQTKYETSLIENHFEDILDPSYSLGIGNKMLPVVSGDKKHSKKIAVHIHSFYPDVLETYFKHIKQWDFKCDLFLTVDSGKKKHEVEKVLNTHGLKAKKIEITGPKGRDVIPWLKISKDLEKYDVVGHFHTKKSKTVNAYIGRNWLNELISQLFNKKVVNNILANFANNDRLGIVIPDIPNVFAYLGGTVSPFENRLKPHVKSLWSRIKPSKGWSIDDQLVFIMPYGTMLWYRPKALDKLMKVKIAEDEIPDEPLSDDFGTILHAIERILVYVSWDAGYHYRLAPTPEYTSRFFDNIAYNRTFSALNGQKDQLTISTKDASKLVVKRVAKKIYRNSPKLAQDAAKKIWRNK